METDFDKDRFVENILEKKYEAQNGDIVEVDFNNRDKRTQETK